MKIKSIKYLIGRINEENRLYGFDKDIKFNSLAKKQISGLLDDLVNDFKGKVPMGGIHEWCSSISELYRYMRGIHGLFESKTSNFQLEVTNYMSKQLDVELSKHLAVLYVTLLNRISTSIVYFNWYKHKKITGEHLNCILRMIDVTNTPNSLFCNIYNS